MSAPSTVTLICVLSCETVIVCQSTEKGAEIVLMTVTLPSTTRSMAATPSYTSNQKR